MNLTKIETNWIFSFYWCIFLMIFPRNVSVRTNQDFRNIVIDWIFHWTFFLTSWFVTVKRYGHSKRQENSGLELFICPKYPEDRHCGKEEHCWQCFPCSVFENIFPNRTRGDQVSLGRFNFPSYNFKTDLEERACLQKWYQQVVEEVLNF